MGIERKTRTRPGWAPFPHLNEWWEVYHEDRDSPGRSTPRRRMTTAAKEHQSVVILHHPSSLPWEEFAHSGLLFLRPGQGPKPHLMWWQGARGERRGEREDPPQLRQTQHERPLGPPLPAGAPKEEALRPRLAGGGRAENNVRKAPLRHINGS